MTFLPQLRANRLAVVAPAAVVLALLIVTALGAATSSRLSIANRKLSDGKLVSGSIPWIVIPTHGSPTRVEFRIDGDYRWTEHNPPYVFRGDGNMLNTRRLADGAHTLTAVAYSGKRTAATSSKVIVANTNRIDVALNRPASASSSKSKQQRPPAVAPKATTTPTTTPTPTTPTTTTPTTTTPTTTTPTPTTTTPTTTTPTTATTTTPPVVPAGITVSVDQLQAAVNSSKGGEVFLVKPGTARYQLILPSWANVQVRGLDPANPPVFVGGGLDGYYAIYSEGPSTIGPDLTISNPNGYGIGVRANTSDITGGRVTGVNLYRNGVSGLYQGTQPGRTHTGFKVDNVIGRENGQRLDLDPHSVKGDGEHTIYIGGGEGITTGALVTSSASYDQLHGTAFQGGGGLRDSRFEHLKAYRVRATPGLPPSSFAGLGIFSSYMGTSGVVIDDLYVEDCDGYGAKAIGGAKGVITNSRSVRSSLGFQYGLADGGGNTSG